jgi:hypothetical protein
MYVLIRKYEVYFFTDAYNFEDLFAYSIIFFSKISSHVLVFD